MNTREKQDAVLKEDIEDVLNNKESINKKTNGFFDETRILGVIAVGKGAEAFLPYTIPKIITQLSEVGVKIDIIIGLNNGFECPYAISRFALIENIRLIHLYTGARVGRNVASTIFDNPELKGEPYCLKTYKEAETTNRIFLLHQKQGKYTAGKMRVLGDIYQLLLNCIDDGWTPPEFTIVFDAESIFLENASEINLHSNGLKLLIKKLVNNPEIDILGVRLKQSIYSKQDDNSEHGVLIPDFSRLVPPVPFFLNLVHGRYRKLSWKPGPGTIGKTDLIISLLLVITKKYSVADDSFTTVLAYHAGFKGGIYTDVVVTDRSPDLAEVTSDQPQKLAWEKKIVRWIADRNTLERNYGKDNIELISGYSRLSNVIICAYEFLRYIYVTNEFNCANIFKKLNCLCSAMYSMKKIKKEALALCIAREDDLDASW